LQVVQGGAALGGGDGLGVEADAERAGVVERAFDGGTGGGVAPPPQGHRDDAHIRVVALQLAFERILHGFLDAGVDAAMVGIQGHPVLLNGFGWEIGEEVFFEAADREGAEQAPKAIEVGDGGDQFAFAGLEGVRELFGDKLEGAELLKEVGRAAVVGEGPQGRAEAGEPTCAPIEVGDVAFQPGAGEDGFAPCFQGSGSLAFE